jgi:multicomponent Na+:H+ antiporter subunit D
VRVLLPLPVVLPLLGAGLSIAFGRWRWVQRVIGVGVLTATSVISIVLLVLVDRDGTAAAQMGAWEAPIGITLVADRLAGIMLATGSIMLLAVLVYAIGQGGAEQQRVAFHPVYLVLSAGVGLSFLTGDLFNLFVAFEMMLTASYVLITLGGRPEQIRTGMTYVVISLIASALFLSSLALIYAATGTVNMADLAGKMAELPDAVRLAFSLLLLVVFGIKAALFPLFFWLPDSYPTAPSPVTAVFAGLLTKVGVYAIIRTQLLLIPPESRPAGIILVIAGLTMLIGVLGAIAQDDMKRILSFHIVSQIGYMVMGLGLFTVAGIAAAIFYVANQIILKSTLLLVTGLVEHSAGSSGLKRVGGLARRFPLLGWLFLLPALSLAGVPPFSGFVAKLAVVQAGIDSRAWAVVAVSLLVSVMTLFSMTKIWGGAFWGTPEVAIEPRGVVSRWGGTAPMLGATAALVVISLAIAIWAGPLYDLTVRSAEELLDPSAYISVVLG